MGLHAGLASALQSGRSAAACPRRHARRTTARLRPKRPPLPRLAAVHSRGGWQVANETKDFFRIRNKIMNYKVSIDD